MSLQKSPLDLDVKYITRPAVVQLLNEHGFPITLSYLNFLCSPAQGKGPPAAGRWGKVDVYRPDTALTWAVERLQPPQHSDAR